MENLTLIAELLSIIAFFFYGTSCLLSKKIVVEFERYKLAKFRPLTGILQILGALGLLVGLLYPWFTFIASLGLSAQMFLGVGVRIRIKDTIFQASPAIFFSGLNLFIFWRSCIELQLITS